MWKNLEIRKNTTSALKFKHPGDLRTEKFIFVVKPSKSPLVSADIVKKNLVNGGSDSEIYVSYDTIKKESEIKVFVLPADTINLGQTKYYYSLKNESNPNELFYGKIYFISTIISGSENVAGAFRYYIGNNTEKASLALTLGASDEGLVWFYSTDDDSLYVWSGTNFI